MRQRIKAEIIIISQISTYRKHNGRINENVHRISQDDIETQPLSPNPNPNHN